LFIISKVLSEEEEEEDQNFRNPGNLKLRNWEIESQRASKERSPHARPAGSGQRAAGSRSPALPAGGPAGRVAR